MRGLSVTWKQREKYEKATLAIAGLVFIQAVVVCIFRVPLVVGYTGLFLSVTMASYCNGMKEAFHEEAMKT